MITLSFHGAAGTVTGSKYLLDVNRRRVLIDCGVFQGRKELRKKNWDRLPFDPASIDAVILTHAHIDHIGYLPRLVAQGFRGRVFATEPSIEVAKLLLADSARINEEDADYRNRKGLTSHEKALPLFTAEDVENTIPLMEPVYFDNFTELGPEIRFRPHRGGHILGASFVEIHCDDGNVKRSILFSGDIGRYGSPIIPDPVEPPQTDYLVCESTYGGRLHPPEDPLYTMETVIKDTVRHKRVLLIPAFAVGRTQQIILLINELIAHKRIKPITINIDSPMAVSATDIYCKFPGYHRLEVNRLGGDKCILAGKHVKLHRKRKSSKMLNKLSGPAIIVSASGMLSGGRILHHLINRLPKEDTTLMMVGYAAEGTLGRRIADGDRRVYIHKQPIDVRARVMRVQGLSGHADYQEILHWLEPVKTAHRRLFITHGEDEQSRALAEHLKAERGWDAHIPSLHESVEL